ncbi:MAG: cysteine hydrolase [Gammaproteobacteria bacterium]
MARVASAAALLALHYQNENCHPDGKIKIGIAAGAEEWRAATLANAGRLLRGARAAGAPVIHVRLAVNPDYRDVIPNTPLFRQWIELGAWAEGSWGAAFYAGLEPTAEEPVVTHIRNNPFHASSLELILHALQPRTLVVAGVSTTYVVESTVRHATDLGYAVTVAHDACSSGSREAHEASLKALRWLAEVQSVDDVLARFDAMQF